MTGEHSTSRKFAGWFLILVLGGPIILIVSYSFLYAILPQGANPSLVLLPLVLSALLVIAIAFVITFILQERGKQVSTPTGGGNESYAWFQRLCHCFFRTSRITADGRPLLQ